MSLINDALKRVSSQGTGAVTPPPIPGIMFNDAAPERASGQGKTLIAVGGVLVAILVAGTILLQTEKAVAKDDSKATPAQAAVTAAPAGAVEGKPSASSIAERLTKPLEAAQAVAAATQARNSEGVQAAAAIESASVPVAVPTAATPAPEAVPAAVPAQKTALQLQAIYYRLKNPTAVINGQTVREGDLLAGGRVAIINRNSVELDVAGSRKVLRFK